MANQVDNNKFTWVIRNFSSLPSGFIFSDHFVIGNCKWRLLTYVCNKSNYLTLFLEVANHESLPPGWSRHARLNLTIVNQNRDKSFKPNGAIERWFNQGCTTVALTELYAKDGGFLVNDALKIVVEVKVLEVIGKLDVSEPATRPLKKIKLESTESMDVNGFQVLPSQVELVKHILERHPDMASEVKAKNQHLRTAYMNVLFSLIQMLGQPPKELTNEDMVEADNALAYVKHAGFKVDWLEEVMEKKSGEIRIQELEIKLKDFEKKYSDKKALVEKEKKELEDLELKCLSMKVQLEEEKAKVFPPPIFSSNVE